MSFSVNRSRFILSLLAVASACSETERPEPSPENRPPVIGARMVFTDEDVAVQIAVLEDASDPDGDTLSVGLVSAPGHEVKLLAGGIIELSPRRDFHGMVAVTFQVGDGTFAVPGMALVTVKPVNDAPEAFGGTKAIHRPAPITLDGRDVDGDSLSFEIVGGPAHGTVTGAPPAIQYAPDASFVGADEIRFVVRDGTLASEPAVIQLEVRANAAPAAASASVIATEDSERGITLVGTDTDGDPVTLTIETPPANGTLSGTAPNLTYTPKADFHGSDAIEFSVSDGELSSIGTIAITVEPVNDAPTATPGTAATTEDTDSAITLQGSDIDGDTVTFQLAAAPAHGSVVIAGDTATYTPAGNFHGPDSFAVRAFDGLATSAPVTIAIDVAPVNDAPVATAISRTLDEDGSAAVTLAGTDADGDSLGFTVVTGPQHGILGGTPPQVTYTPEANYNGPDSFTYTVGDAAITSAAATVSLDVTPRNDLPTVSDVSVTTDEDTQVAIALQGSDVDGSQPIFQNVTVPSDGTLSGTGASRGYQPALNANGTRTFTFRACDAIGCSAAATVTIAIRPINDAPLAVDDFVATDPGTPLTFGVLGNDTDVDGDTVTLDSVDAPAHGDIEIVDGQLVYTPDAEFAGTDVVAYTVIDSHGEPATGNARIGVGAFPPGAPTDVVATVGGTVSSSSQRVPTISTNARYIAFTSPLPLVGDDSNNVDDIYLFDRTTRQLRRVSVATGGGQSNASSFRPHLSGDGRYVVFDSPASNLVAGDTNGKADVFRHDRVTGETIRVSVATGGAQGSAESFDSGISDDGNLVAFMSLAFELVDNDVNGTSDVFVRDIAAGTTTRVSVAADGGEAELGSTQPVISGDGRFVAFSSQASNLVAGDTNNLRDVFVRDRVAGTTTRVSVSSTGGESNGTCSVPSLSRDGRFVSFTSNATTLVPGTTTASSRVYVRDVVGTTTTAVGSSGVLWAELSDDGRYATVFESFSGSGVSVRDRFNTATARPAGSNFWLWPTISGNGRYIVVLDTGGRIIIQPNPL